MHHHWPVITFHGHLIRFHYPHQDGSTQQEEPREHCESLKQMSRARSTQGEQREPELECELSAYLFVTCFGALIDSFLFRLPRCPEGATQCRCRRILFNEPDFVGVPSLFEECCAARHFKVIILLEFHCELNFIEQCWGYAKRLYRLYPPTKKDEEMEINVHKALDSVPIECMHR
jgi:hypothetical protein